MARIVGFWCCMSYTSADPTATRANATAEYARQCARSCLLGSLDRLADTVATLALFEEDAETLEVVELPAALERGAALCPAGCGPLLRDALRLEDLLHRAGASAARQLLGDELRQGEVAVGVGLARDAGRGVVDECLQKRKRVRKVGGYGLSSARAYAVVVDYVDDDSSFARRRTGLEEDDCTRP